MNYSFLTAIQNQFPDHTLAFPAPLGMCAVASGGFVFPQKMVFVGRCSTPWRFPLPNMSVAEGTSGEVRNPGGPHFALVG